MVAQHDQNENFLNTSNKLNNLNNFQDEINIPKIVEELVLHKFGDRLRRRRRRFNKKSYSGSVRNDNLSSIDSDLNTEVFRNKKSFSCTLKRSNKYVKRKYDIIVKQSNGNNTMLSYNMSNDSTQDKICFSTDILNGKFHSNFIINRKINSDGSSSSTINTLKLEFIRKVKEKQEIFKSESYCDSNSVSSINISFEPSKKSNETQSSHKFSLTTTFTEYTTPVDTPETVTPTDSPSNSLKLNKTGDEEKKSCVEDNLDLYNIYEEIIEQNPANATNSDNINCLELSAKIVSPFCKFIKNKNRAKTSKKAAEDFREPELGEDYNNSIIETEQMESLSDPEPIYEIIENSSYRENRSMNLEELNDIITQLSKAIIYCRSTKLATSSYRFEAEKLLLSAMCRRELLSYDITHNNVNEPPPDNIILGTVSVKDLIFFPKHYELQNKIQEKRHYLCLISYNSCIQESDIIEPDEYGIVHFPNSFIFENTPPNFKVGITLFSMKSSKKYLKESTIRQASCLNRICCDDLNDNSDEFSMFPSSFTFCGRSIVNLFQLNSDNVYFLHNTPVLSYLSTFQASIDVTVNFEKVCEGNLTISEFCDDTSLSSTKQWCVLFGPLLYCYDSSDYYENKTLINTIDLRENINNTITPMSCVKGLPSRTFLLELYHENKNIKYFISTDNEIDFRNWANSFEFVMINLTKWNCLNC